MDLDLTTQAKSIVNELLLSNVTELFHELLSHERFSKEINAKTCWQYWIIEPSFADILINDYKDEIVFFFYGLLIWGRQQKGNDIYLDDLILDIAKRKLGQKRIGDKYVVLGNK